MASIYISVEQKCRQFTKQMISFVLFQQVSFVFAFFYSIYCIHVGNFDTSTYYLPLRLASPFEINSLFKWYLFWVFEFVGGITYLGGTVVVALYFVCCCFYLQALCDHFDCLIEQVDDELSKKLGVPIEPAIACIRSLNARKLLSNTIEHHNKIYE